MEHPDRTAVADLYSAKDVAAFTVRVAPRPQGWLSKLWHRLFDESNFAEAVDLKPVRDKRIRLMTIAVDSATRLNRRSFSMRYGPALDLDEDEIIVVICETVRILMLEGKIREALDDLRLSPAARPNAGT